jgi:manganese/zinc/iron transport system substrate-binding protein
MAEALERLDATRPTLAVGERIARARLIAAEGDAVDPHLWFDVIIWKDVALVVRDTLVEFDPDGKDGYLARAEALVAELLALDAEVREQIARIPAERRTMITAHDAFRYFGQAYGLEVVGIQGLSTESEAAVHRINELVDVIVRRGLPAVFVESTISPKNVEALIEGCAARGHTLRIGGELYSDAMGPAGTPEGTYIGMVRHNVRTIVEALR